MTDVAPASFDRVARIYDATRGIPPEPEAEMADALAGIFRRVGNSPRILEVGVGTGRIALPLSARGCRITGIDIASRMLCELRRKGDLQLVKGPAEPLPFVAGSFDAALFVHVLHLVPDAGAAVRAAIESVRGRGMLVFANDDLPREGLWGESNQLIREVVGEVSGTDLRQYAGHVLAIEALNTELEAVDAESSRVALAAWQQRFRGRDLLEQLAGRMMSWMWAIPESRLSEVVERVRPRLEALCDGLDREHPQPRSMSALVARLR